MQVKEAMNKKVVIAFPETKITEIARLMAKYGIGSVIIVNKIRSIVGIVTERDVMNVVAKMEDPRKLRASDIMSTGVITIDESRTIKEAAEIMIQNKIKKLPVVKKKEIRGIITATDVMIANAELSKRIRPLMESKGPDKGLVEKDFVYLNIVG